MSDTLSLYAAIYMTSGYGTAFGFSLIYNVTTTAPNLYLNHAANTYTYMYPDLYTYSCFYVNTCYSIEL